MRTYPQVDPLQKSRSPSQGGANKEMQVGTQFTCFTGTRVRALLVHEYVLYWYISKAGTEAFCRLFSRDGRMLSMLTYADVC